MNHLLLLLALTAADIDWAHYGRDAGGTRYSPLNQITRQNVTGMKQVWEYHTGALLPETHLKDRAAFEEVMYGRTEDYRPYSFTGGDMWELWKAAKAHYAPKLTESDELPIALPRLSSNSEAINLRFA